MNGNLTRNTEKNLGGLCKIYLLPIKNAPTVRWQSTEPLRMKTNLFYETPFIYQTGAYKFEGKESDQGMVFNHSINFDLDNYRDSILDFVSKNLIRKAYNIAFYDANHNLRLLGDKQYSMFINIKAETGEKRNDHNLIQFDSKIQMPCQARKLIFDDNAGDFLKLDFSSIDFK